MSPHVDLQDISDIFQGDANDTLVSDSTSDSVDNDNISSINNTDDEVDAAPSPVNLTLVPGQASLPRQPVILDVDPTNVQVSSLLPLCMMLNARSVYKKAGHFRDLYQLGPDLIITSETWEKKSKPLADLIGTNNYQTISYYRTGGRSGGGCAIIYTDTRFIVEKLDVDTGEGVEAVWALFTPRGVTSNSRVRRIAVGSFYVSPNSVYKTATIEMSRICA